MDFHHPCKFLLGIAAAWGLSLPTIAQADNTAPAITAFNAAWSATNDYTCTMHSHESLGDKTQDRVYNYWFMKPHFAKTLIVSGDGQGSGGVWSGGDTVSGHQGGILSGLHLTVSIHDPRATSIRGFTIPDGLLNNIVDKYVTVAGALTQVPGGRLGGVLTDRLDLKVTDPAQNNGISEQILYLSQETHFPVRQILYSGNQTVLDQSISDLKTNVGLTAKDF
jgi:outer membrane lipoprotein-sorting protein